MQKQRFCSCAPATPAAAKLRRLSCAAMVATILRSLAPGLQSKPINPLTYKVMAEVGYDLAGHYSKKLTN